MLANLLWLGIGLACLVWAFWVEPYWMGVTEVTVPLKEWAGTGRRMRIAIAADLHLRPGERKRAAEIVALIEEQRPDAVFLVGDFCNGHKEGQSMALEEIAECLKGLPEKFPTFAVMGNHDEYYDAETLRRELTKRGIVVLEDKGIVFRGGEQGAEAEFSGVRDVDSDSALSVKFVPKQKEENPMILLSHRPDIVYRHPRDVSLIVSGHTHGGQVCLPGGYPLETSSRVRGWDAYGLRRLEGQRVLITRGLGMTFLPIRFWCRPEVMMLTLCGEEKKGGEAHE